MGTSWKFTFKPVSNSILCEAIKDLDGRHIVWWYGGISKGPRPDTVPRCAVIFRTLLSDGTPGDFVRQDVALTWLGLLRIGTVWKSGRLVEQAVLKAKTFEVDFTEGHWSFVSPREAQQEGHSIVTEDYDLPAAKTRSWLLDFPIDDEKRNLCIPCLEFLMRCYGQSQELVRILVTYPWSEAESRFYTPTDTPAAPGFWPIRLKLRLHNGDAVFLAHTRYDPYAQKVAKSIYSHLEAAFGSRKPYAFIKVAPWFQGKATLKVEGLWINGRRTFLGLRILGRSDPKGATIVLEREHLERSKQDTQGGDAPDSDSYRFPVKVLTQKPDPITLTDDAEPDRGSATVEVEEQAVEILGIPRTIIRSQDTVKADASPGRWQVPDESDKFGTGDPYGSGKGVGHTDVHAPRILESQGILRDMWNAMRFLQRQYPKVIQTVEWFTFRKGFRSDEEPKMISLRPFDAGEDVSQATRNWVYLDLENKIPRGVLVVRLLVKNKPVYILEIQRRPESEESFKGLVFQLDDPRQFQSWLRNVLSRIRHVRGVVQKLTGLCPGRAAAFKHAPSRTEQVPCQAAVLNALEKMEVDYKPL